MTTLTAWLAALARRLLQRDTFETVVSPAIADLQLEAESGLLIRARHYVALAAVLPWALFADLRTGAVVAFDADAWRSVWQRVAWWYAGSFVFFAWLQLDGDVPWHLLDSATTRAALVSSALGIPLSALAPATVAAVFYLQRRDNSTWRTIAAATLVIVAFTFVWTLATRIVLQDLRTQIYEQVTRALPLAAGEVGHPQHQWHIWLEYRAESLRAFWPSRSAASIVPWALLGVVLAKGRGWGVPVRLAGFAATWIALAGTLLWFGRFSPTPSNNYQRWRDVALMLATAMLWLLIGRLLRCGSAPAVRTQTASTHHPDD